MTCHRFVDLADAGDLSRAIGFVCDDCRAGKAPEATARPRSDRPPARRIGKGAARKPEPLQVVTVHEVHDTPGPSGAAPSSATPVAPAPAPPPRPAPEIAPPPQLASPEPELRAAPARSDPPRAPAAAARVRPSSRPPPAPVVVPEPPPEGKGGRARVVVALLAIAGGAVLLTRVWPSSPTAEPVAAQRPPHDDSSSAAPVPPPAPTGASPMANATGSASAARGARPADTTKPFDPPSGTAPPAPGPAAFDKDAANAAIATASQQVLSCKKSGDPSGVAKLDITFAPSGHVTSSKVGGKPFAGTTTGSCLAQLFRGVTVPPFEGEPVTLAKTVSIP